MPETTPNRLTDVAKDVLGMSCDKVMRGEDRAQVICGVGLDVFVNNDCDTVRAEVAR